MRTRRLLFVCSGNLHRSVMAAAMARVMFDQLGRPAQVVSAGTLNLQGHASPPEVHAVCAELGIDTTSHRSQGLTRSLLQHAERIVVMEDHHWERAVELDPQCEGRLIHLGDYLEEVGDVPDPIGGDLTTFRTSRDMILRAMQKVLPKLL